MPGPASYAGIAPRARIMKSMLLTPDKIKEMMSTTELKDALAQLRESLYTQASEASTIEEAYRLLERSYMELLSKLEKTAPPEAVGIVHAFRRDYELRDVLTALQRVIAGAPGLDDFPTYHLEDSLLRRISQDPEALANHTRFVEALEGTWAYPYLDLALKLYGDSRNPMMVSWAHLYGSIELYTLPLSSARAVAGEDLTRLICPIVEYKVATGALQAKAGNLDSRLVERLIAPCKPCGIDPGQVRQLYDREAAPEDLATSMRDMLKYIRLEGNSLGPILASARRSLRIELRNGIKRTFQSYPFTPSLVAAAAIMIRLELEDVNTILTSIVMGLKPNEYSPLLIIDK